MTYREWMTATLARFNITEADVDLILANQGETIEDYLKRIPDPCFPADDNNVIPMLDDD